jgi:hypothetical protein
MLFGGIVDQNVDTAEFTDDLAHEIGSEVGVANVAWDRERALAFGFDQAGGFGGVLALIEPGNGYVSALLGETDGDRTTNAGIAAGDQGYLAGEFIGGAISCHFSLGPRLHLGLTAGLVRLGLRGL